MRKFKRIIRPYKEYILFGCLLIVSILVGVFVLIPGIKKVLLLRRQIQTTAAEIDVLRNKAALLASLSEETLGEKLRELTSALPGDVSSGSIFSTIDGVINETGVTVGTYSVENQGKAKPDKSGGTSVPIDLVAKGSFDQIQQFVVLLPKVRRLFRIHSVSFSIHENRVSSIITADAPYKKLPTTIGGLLSTLSPFTPKEDAVFLEVERYPNFASDLTKEFTPELGSVPRDPFAR